MSSEPAILLRGVRKSFAIYRKPHHRLLHMVAPGVRRWHDEFHALRGIDMTVARGETVGIVGRNGSGKSTLLQVICGTLAPSAGEVRVGGRIAALLELGAGFNPEFTGRENVLLNGTILGLTAEEVAAKFDEIVAFADIGDFIEQPVKTYSSGMYVRLAFAVAIHVDPEILVVDEALSVGDEGFQRKCFARIDAIRDRGAAVLFVSHAAGTVVDLCDRALLLDRGEVIAEGTPKHVVSRYQKLLGTPAASLEQVREEIRTSTSPSLPILESGPEAEAEAALQDDDAYFDPHLIPSSLLRYERRGASIESPHLQTLGGRPVNVLVPGGEYVYSYQVTIEETLAHVRCGMMIRTITGIEVGGAVSESSDGAMQLVAAATVLNVRIRFRCRLAPGTYFMNAGVLARIGMDDVFVDRLIDAVMFRVMPHPGRLATGLVDLDVVPQVRVEP
jgi:lipopolysaccharide transport system ATP-binding protein